MQIIDQQKELDQICKKLQNEEILGIDSEFVREDTFVPILCLLQVATKDEIYIIDPLELDVKNFLKILTNEKILKIFHSPRQDFDVFYQNFKIIPKNIFDTQIAAGMLGFGDSISYAKLVKQICKKEICKESKLANWHKRPLSKKSLNYAASDVEFLFEIHAYLIERLNSRGRMSWFDEEIELLLDKENYHLHKEDAWHRIGKSSHVKFYNNYLQAFAALREEIAIKRNKPRRWIVKDEIITHLATIQPESEEQLKDDRLLKRLDKNLIEQFLEVSLKVKKTAKEELKNGVRKHVSEKDLLLIDLIKILLKKTAHEQKIAARFIATSEDISNFVTGHHESRLSSGWRYEVLGKVANSFKDGKLSIHVKDGFLNLEKLAA